MSGTFYLPFLGGKGLYKDYKGVGCIKEAKIKTTTAQRPTISKVMIRIIKIYKPFFFPEGTLSLGQKNKGLFIY